MQISDFRDVEKVFNNIRKNFRLSSFELEEKTNVLIWGLFTSTTMKASVHLGPSYDENLVVEQSFEIQNVATMI